MCFIVDPSILYAHAFHVVEYMWSFAPPPQKRNRKKEEEYVLNLVNKRNEEGEFFLLKKDIQKKEKFMLYRVEFKNK